jgi:hypothetical protein
MHKQKPLEIPDLEEIAGIYWGHWHIVHYGRAFRVREFIKKALEAWSMHEQAAASQFVWRLYFDPPGILPRRPGVRLDELRKETKLNRKEFEDLQRRIFVDFGSFLMCFSMREEWMYHGPVPPEVLRSESLDLGPPPF